LFFFLISEIHWCAPLPLLSGLDVRLQ